MVNLAVFMQISSKSVVDLAFFGRFIEICGGFGPFVVDLKHFCGHFGFFAGRCHLNLW